MAQMTPSRVSPWRAVLPMLFARERFIELAIAHSLALCAANSQYQSAMAQGQFPSASWEAETRANLTKYTTSLLRAFWSSLGVTCAFIALGVIAALLFGRLSPDRPLDLGKLLSVLGAFLAGWATLFELGGVVATFSGEQLHELVHPVLFRGLFLPGVALATTGQVW